MRKDIKNNVDLKNILPALCFANQLDSSLASAYSLLLNRLHRINLQREKWKETPYGRAKAAIWIYYTLSSILFLLSPSNKHQKTPKTFSLCSGKATYQVTVQQCHGLGGHSRKALTKMGTLLRIS